MHDKQLAHPAIRRMLIAALLSAVTWPLLTGFSFTPASLVPVLVIATGVAGFVAPELGIALSLGLAALPILAADIAIGIAFLLGAAALFPFLTRSSGTVYILVSGALVSAALGPVWIIAPLAGLLLGPAAGAGAAVLGCLSVQGAATLTAHTHLGMVASATTGPGLAAMSTPPADLIGLAWLPSAVEALDPTPLMAMLPTAARLPLVIGQAVVWACGAVAAGVIVRPPGHRNRAASAVAGVAAGVMVTALGHVAVLGMYGALPEASAVGAFTTSLLLAVSAVAVREWVFPPTVRVRRAAPSHTARTESDVDELLTAIAAAEGELASKHVTSATVLISDMLAFTALTEMEGSLVSAQVVHQQRELLLPIIAGQGGRGAAAGGDGLVAAFADSLAAVSAAIAMQQALASYNLSAPAGQKIMVRIGIAHGEVVVDRAGRPFIGEAINRAARIMQLADGGEVCVSSDIAEAADLSGLATEARGTHELRNISEPVEVSAILVGSAPAPRVSSPAARATQCPPNAKAPA